MQAMRAKSVSAAADAKAAQDSDSSLADFSAKSMILGSDGIIWKLLGVFLVPLLIGLKLDDIFQTSPSLTVTGVMIAALGVSVVVYSAVKGEMFGGSESQPPTRKDSKKN